MADPEETPRTLIRALATAQSGRRRGRRRGRDGVAVEASGQPEGHQEQQGVPEKDRQGNNQSLDQEKTQEQIQKPTQLQTQEQTQLQSQEQFHVQAELDRENRAADKANKETGQIAQTQERAQNEIQDSHDGSAINKDNQGRGEGNQDQTLARQDNTRPSDATPSATSVDSATPMNVSGRQGNSEVIGSVTRQPRETPRTFIRGFLREAPIRVRARESIEQNSTKADSETAPESIQQTIMASEGLITSEHTLATETPEQASAATTAGIVEGNSAERNEEKESAQPEDISFETRPAAQRQITQTQTNRPTIVSLDGSANNAQRGGTATDDDDDDDDAFFAVSAATKAVGGSLIVPESNTGNQRYPADSSDDDEEDAFRAAANDPALRRRQPDRRRRRRRTLVAPELLSEEKSRSGRISTVEDENSKVSPAEYRAHQRARRGKRPLEDPYSLIATPLESANSSKIQLQGTTPSGNSTTGGASPASLLSVGGPVASTPGMLSAGGETPEYVAAQRQNRQPSTKSLPSARSAFPPSAASSVSRSTEFETPSALPRTTLLAGSSLQDRATPEWRRRAMARPYNQPLPPLFEEEEEGEGEFQPARKKPRKRKPYKKRTSEAMVGGDETVRAPRVPHLPDTIVKKLWSNLLKARDFSSDGSSTTRAVLRASTAFFEQASDDLATYADHAGRRTIELDDIKCLFARQRFIDGDPEDSLADLARKHLSREYADEVLESLE
mmetsp:Transcript_1163/g.2781  ORF Transcript_1163/g.2781 Transcript_1163/m.2781 type:complete len:731 (+) Transcript_1163:68-2260(+)|eukprot:CAMPEP_0171539878 /NCGR_PEP_ID=MMETSP0960-20121227/869_1 /TAXON_ID=87120 /ORGANISM="Aurantiochytrium limacinum, Strain ATCCMYA-1381" /LENGTH=730 /DNA_ID=CAMNT_0012086983 /DNA_START=22 /DNA_END=2214 /DNA_ORIENTATION=+